MGTNSVDQKWVQPISAENEEEDDEEALSLRDLPTNEENQSRKEEEEEEKEAAAESIMKTQEEFEFGSRGGSVLTETEMCAADELFFQGQILPLRYYVSSETGSAAMPRVGFRNPMRSIPRSGSMDRSHSSGLTSVSSSSSSSSIRSQHSSSSGTTNKKRLQSQFLSQPSPKPQTRLPNPPYGNVSHQSRLKSTRMSFFRVGLVRTPGIELQDLKLRSNSNRTRTSDCDDKNGSKIEKKKKKRRALLFRNSCKCSVDAVETVPLMVDDIMMVRSGRNDASEVEEKEDHTVQAMEKKRRKKKQATSHHRTCEWLKELSLVGGPDEA